MIEIGTLDRVTIIVGERGVGKSTFLKQDLRAFQDETGGYALMHSPNGQVGYEEDIVFSDSLEAMQRAIRREPGKIHCLTQGAPEDLFAYATQLSLALRSEAHRKAGKPFNPTRPAYKGVCAPPVMIAIDEGMFMKKQTDTSEGKQELERLLVSARHWHLAVSWSIQGPSARGWTIFEQANRFAIFRYSHEYGQMAIRSAGIPQEIIREIKDLPRFVYYWHEKLTPENSRFVKLAKR